jgi:hypothetical protein
MDTKTTAKSRAATTRSPSYPMLSLPEAIDRVRTLWDKQRKNAVSPAVAMQSLGYKANSGTGGRVISALIQYGFLTEEGKGTGRLVRLTEEARSLMLLEPGDPDWLKFIKAAALRPKIYAEMAQRWQETLPPDAEIRRYLSYERKFNPDTVHDLIKSFRRTYEFASLGSEGREQEENDIVAGPMEQTDFTATDQRGQAHDAGGRERRDTPRPPAKEFQPYTLPLAGGRIAHLHVPPEMSAQDFKLLTLGLKLIEASIVTTSDMPDFDILEPPNVRKGPAIWRNKDFDQPIVVTGYLGPRENKHYVSIEGSTSGIPLDEIDYENAE